MLECWRITQGGHQLHKQMTMIALFSTQAPHPLTSALNLPIFCQQRGFEERFASVH
jgi:hypothetical protein